MSGLHFFVTGAGGATGAWVISRLLDAGRQVTAFDDDDDDRRLRLIRPWAAPATLRRVVGDVTDVEAVTAAMAGATHVVHLGRQTGEGADSLDSLRRVVAGCLSTVEAARRCGVRAVGYHLGPDGPATGDGDDNCDLLASVLPTAARRLWATAGIPSIGIATGALCGAGHDEGWMGEFTEVVAAAVHDAPLVVEDTIRIPLSYGPDLARALIEGVTHATSGASINTLPGEAVTLGEFVAAVSEVTGNDTVAVTDSSAPPSAPETAIADGPLPGFEPTPLRDGIRLTLEILRWAPGSLARVSHARAR